jgi:multiple sugar transport system permease protein
MTTKAKYTNTSPYYSAQLRKFGVKALIFMIALSFCFVYLLPFGSMTLLSLKSKDQQVASATGSILPLDAEVIIYEGEEHNIYNVPFEDGTVRQLALINPSRRTSEFVDPNDLEAGLIEWEGNWRGLEPVTYINPHWSNYPDAWNGLNFPKVFANTLYVAVVGMIGTVLSSICVAYAFARFPIPGKSVLFIILIGTIILPGQVTLIPTYAFFSWLVRTLQLGMQGLGLPDFWASPLRAIIAFLPLTLPHFFANAYNVFLLRQFFMTLPKELDEAAMMDGAGPFRILVQIIIPLSWPAIVAVGLFHFIYSWNDYFAPLIYLLNYSDLNPISVAVQVFNYQFGARPELVQATSLLAMILPLAIFFFAQRIFMRGVVVTGVEK